MNHEDNSTAYFLFDVNLDDLEKSVEFLKFSLNDSLEMLDQNGEKELEHRTFLTSDTVEEAIDEQTQIEHTFYNQLFILLVSYIEAYFKDIIDFDIMQIIERTKPTFEEREEKEIKEDHEKLEDKNVTRIIEMFEKNVNQISKNRRNEILQFVFDFFKIESQFKDEFWRRIKFLYALRNSIIHNKGSIEKIKSSDPNNFEKMLEYFEIRYTFNSSLIKIDSSDLFKLITKSRILIVGLDERISNTQNGEFIC